MISLKSLMALSHRVINFRKCRLCTSIVLGLSNRNGALQAYDGWGNMIYVAGEIREPGKNIPRSLILVCLYASPCLKKISRLRVLQ